MRRFLSIFTALLIICLLCGDSAAAQSSNGPPPPHLGYGIHVGPNTNVDVGLVDQLRLDWVKVYEPGQAANFPGKHILFRMDLPWPTDWNSFRSSVRERAAELSRLGVDAIEVHNEPNLALEWPHGPNAWEYTQLLRVAYTQIKSVDPNIIVVSGGLAPTITTGDRQALSDIDYAREMLDNGAAQWFDAFGYHPYGYNLPPEDEPAEDKLNFRRVELIRALFEERGILDKQIWLTEFGWLRDPAEDGVTCSDADPAFAGFAWLRVSGQTQADYTARAFDWADRYWPWAGPMFLWNLNWSLYPDNIAPPCSHMRWFSLLRRDGSHVPLFDRVASMPRRFSDYLPQLTIYAQNMTIETSQYCPGSVMVGEFKVLNTGYPGSFKADIQAVGPPGGPLIDVYPPTVTSGDTVQIFADTTGLTTGMYIIYVNVSATINEEVVAQMIQGYVVISDIMGGC